MTIENTTCKIECEGEQGTGFFIRSNFILTSNHILSKYVQGCNIEIHNCPNQNNTIFAELIDQCNDCDTALLKIIGDYNNDRILKLCNSTIIEEEEWSSYGYAKTNDGSLIGEPLKGEVQRYIEDSEITIHDINIDPKNFNPNYEYGGFSGSPLINKYGIVFAIIRFENDKNLSAVSIKKAVPFLKKNNIEVEPDQLDSFGIYNTNTFVGFEERQIECEVESQRPISILSPQAIIDSNKGELFYPKKPQNINELIQFLRKSKDINSKLWSGWVQLLTYVEILKGDYKNSNNISIDITSSELFKKFGLIKSTRTVNMKLHLNFYFTEEESYFSIARKSIHENNKKGVSNHTCNVFNSNINEFGNTNKVKVDISNPVGSGPSISNSKIGALSLSQLNREVKSSNSLVDVSDKLKKIFEDAIK